ncbi:MAG TPA: TrpB-like pyridoxal phosphate-dependent enzyme [Anaerolineaceae bacterium]|jgi:tryptophan synthase beta chain|nr:TrpB-like pyridoxal phosphate-dependent enzyme [Anaerolineaceae bacterium]HOR84143.1 TrpB-like pyridoxal phosphate-dependent enzyme [Anaerolineaceae bacterium]HPL42417.1 TrpB-like pyridoxal phosphate-dependent enzyme [Anaerolineaceae bacterium]HPY32629.1 TrpB-like pyridoxal phosphate-dependent enzyme [Anaerolineaceae bacterium]HQC21699.1 TrpB-like pyridoxal phosphate-dependent enzyme [Anaerolineaceae bacterium]
MSDPNNKNRFDLDENEIPRFWYNVNADSPVPPAPVFDPTTKEPISLEALQKLFPLSLIEQETSMERFIPIPEDVREAYKLYRPTPLIRARRLEKLLQTPAHIYYKYEGASPAGSHKLNSAIPQAYYNKSSGTKAMTTETGAGQWGSALAMAGGMFGISVEVYMVNASYLAKPYRRIIMQTYGAQIFPSPSEHTAIGRSYLAKDPNHPGSLGIAISEAVEVAAESNGEKKYGLGSVLNHVILHQTVIGEEALKQMDLAGEYPDVVIGCVGGGSNFAGIALPFLRANLRDGRKTRFLAVEPISTPSLTRGVYGFDYGDSFGIVPILKMHTLGSDFIPDPIHAGGLRYHGMSPIISALYHAGLLEAVAVGQLDVFAAAVQFARAEGILPAPESSHAILAAINEAIDARDKNEQRVILFNLSGHGFLDLSAYDQYLHDGMINGGIAQAQLEGLEERLPKVKMP